MGKLRAAVSRIESISYVDDHQNQDFAHGGDATMMAGLPALGSFVVPYVSYQSASVKPPRPVTVKITCDESVQQKVVSKLVNLRAYRIVAT